MKKFKFTFIIFMLAILFTACNPNDTANTNATIIRVSHGQPLGHPDNEGLLAFKDYIEKNTNGRYEVLIYPNALLGASKNALELCQTGALEFVICSASNMETFNDIYAIFSMPYLFDSEKVYHETMKNKEMMKPIYDSTLNSGLKVVGWLDAGTRNFYTQKPIRTVEDLKGLKIRVQPSPTNVAMMDAFGAAAVPMSFSEVYTAIQNRTIDGAENNEMALTTVKHGEVVKYYNYNKHQMVPDLLVANVSFLENLSPEDKKIFDEAIALCEKVEQEEWGKQTQEAIDTVKEKMNVEFIESDVLSFKEKVLPLHEKIVSQNKKIEPIYRAIQSINEKYREVKK